MNNPQIKFQPELRARKRAEAIADFHSLGTNGPSANELAKLVFHAFSLVRKEQLYKALASLEPYQVTTIQKAFFSRPRRPKMGQSGP